MLEQLFGSRTRVKLLKLFITLQGTPFFVREICRKVDEQLNSVRRELANLMSLGMITMSEQGDKKFYQLNTKFVLAEELRALLIKSQLLVEQDFIRRLKESGKIRYLALTGSFTGAKMSPTDILLVGKVDRPFLVRAIEKFQREAGRELNFTVLSAREYNERLALADKFLVTILNNPKVVVVDDFTSDD